jgi:hypothetical protein
VSEIGRKVGTRASPSTATVSTAPVAARPLVRAVSGSVVLREHCANQPELSVKVAIEV